MKKYIIPHTKLFRMEIKDAILNASPSIHHEEGYPEDAANIGGLF